MSAESNPDESDPSESNPNESNSAENNSGEDNRPHSSQNHSRFPHSTNKIGQPSTLCYSSAYTPGQPMNKNSDLFVVCRTGDPLSASAHSYMDN